LVSALTRAGTGPKSPSVAFPGASSARPPTPSASAAAQAGQRPLTNEQTQRIRALATDLPALWNNPATPIRERKRLIRLLVTDVTLIKTGEQITAHVRLSGGQQHTLTIPRPRRAWEAHTTPASTIAPIDQLLDHHTYDETVEILNQQGLTGGWGQPFTVVSLTQLCRNRGIPSHHERLRAAGMLTLDEVAAQFGVTTDTVKIWQRRGHITGRRIDGRRAHLYHPGQNRPTDGRRRHKQPQPQPSPPAVMIAPAPSPTASQPQTHQEVQYERHSLLKFSSIAASTPALCLRIVRASLTNGWSRERDAHASHASRRSGASSLGTL
jgi:hypothetical protein